MIKILKKINLDDAVLDITHIDSTSIVLDASYKLYLFSLPGFSLKGQKSLGKDFEKPHRHANSFKSSKTGLLNIPIIGTERSVLLSTGAKIEKIMVNSWHEGDIESAAFSKDGTLLATGGTDGKVFVFDTKNRQLIFSVPPRGEYISDITFGSNGDLMASSSYDKFTTLYSIIQNKVVVTFKQTEVIERAAFFHNDTMLYMISRSGRSILYDIIKKETVSQEAHFSKWPSAIAVTQDEKYAIVGTRGDRLYVIRLEDNTKMLELGFEYSGFSALDIYKTNLIAGFIDGMMVVVDYNNGEENLKAAIDSLDFKAARKIIEDNVFLTIHPSVKAFDEHWKEYLDKAVKKLNENNIEEAVEITEPFLFDPKKQGEFEFYLKQQGPVKQFMDIVAAKDYAKAYEMVNLNSFLKKTTYYTDLEDQWNKTFNLAKKLLEEDPVMNHKKVEMVFKPFATTPKKDIIYQLMKNTNVFIQADKYIKEQKFKEYFNLTEKFFFLKEGLLYEKVTNMGQKLMDRYHELEKKQDYEAATELAKKIIIFPMFKKQVTERLNALNAKSSFIDAVANKDNTLAFRLVEKNESLKALPQFKDLQSRFENVFNEAKQHAFVGEPKSALLKLGDVKELSFWRDKVASIMKLAYLNEMKIFAKDREVNWDLTLKRYIRRYGKDAELRKIMKDMNKLEILEAIEDSGSSEGYKNAELVDYIVVHKGDA